MSTIFDTLEYVHKLKEAGVPENQAETHARALAEIIQSNLATRQDIEKTKAELTIEIEKMKMDLCIKIEKTRTELIKWNLGTMFTAIGVVAAIVKLLG